MGLDIHALNFIRYAGKRQPLGDTITIGRQSLHVPEAMVSKIVQTKPSYENHPYGESLLVEYFGASKVDSVDNSDYEAATYVHDMNEALPQALWNKYDTVIDGGSSEHIFNTPQALKNYSLFCRPGGQILHLLPANNFCGHGFWQFSPELFFSLYSEANGYSQTEVFLANVSNTRTWFKVKEPKNGQRVNVSTSTALYVLVRTVLQRAEFSHATVQQSDYIHKWENTPAVNPKAHNDRAGLKRRLKESPMAYQLVSSARQLYLKAKRSQVQTRLNDKNPGIKAVPVRSLTSS